MPRPISFAKTVDAVENRDKTVTRRYDAWEWLEPDTILKPVTSQTDGEPIFDDTTMIRVVSVRTEPVDEIRGYGLLECPACEKNGYDIHGPTSKRHRCDACHGTNSVNVECVREGLAHLSAVEFIEMFTDLAGCDPDDPVTRIEFEYVDADQLDE